MNEAAVIRVLVVDDHMVVRKGFATFLKAYQDLQLVGEAANGAEAIALCPTLRPDVVLMDMVMPGMDGVETTRKLREQCPDIQVIALTSFGEDSQYIQPVLEAGAIGYLFKTVSIQELAEAIRNAHAGKPSLSSEAMSLLIQSSSQRSSSEFNLSQREVQVLKLLCDGQSNREIAEALMLSQSTVKFHVSSILGKLGASSRTEAASIAYQHNLV